MKKIVKLLPLVFLILLCGCNSQNTDSTYHMYYVNKDTTKIVEKNYELEDTDTQGLIKEFLIALSTDSGSVEYTKPLPNDVEITNYTLNGNQLFLYFDEDYYNMDAVEEVLCRAAIVRTMIQIPEVSCVSFYIGDAPLADSKGNVVGLMTEESFIENPGKQINAIQTASIHLYFSNTTGDGLVETTEEVQYSTNMSMEKVIMENLLAGPKEKGMIAAIPDGTELVSVTTTDGTCYVNLDETFMNQVYEIQEPIVIYSIVNSLSEVPTINNVQISVNGDTSGVYRNSFALDTLYERDLDYVVSEGKETTTENSEGDMSE